jgi:exopolysaccharide biosynthesis polyprenyl glycosylphosphotransferase
VRPGSEIMPVAWFVTGAGSGMLAAACLRGWPPTLPIILIFAGLLARRDGLQGSRCAVIRRACASASLAVLFGAVVGILSGQPSTAGTLVAVWVGAVVGTAVVGVVGLLQRAPARTLIVEAGEGFAASVQDLAAVSEAFVPVGRLGDRIEGGTAESIPYLGCAEDVVGAATRSQASTVIIAISAGQERRLAAAARSAANAGLNVIVTAGAFDLLPRCARLSRLGGRFGVVLATPAQHRLSYGVKCIAERVAALALLIALSPILLVLALAVRLSGPGPVLFRQVRVGKDGHQFELLKFRSMSCSGTPTVLRSLTSSDQVNGPGGVEGVDRRTPVGKVLRGSSLDELPQLINVVRGDMALVGPRPERPEYAGMFNDNVPGYRDRLRVKSGITGLAQVNGLRGNTSMEERVRLDNEYIDRWSLGLEAAVLLRTVPAMLKSAE